MRNFLTSAVLFFLASGWSAAGELTAPSELKVEVWGTNSFLLQWKDNSTAETGWEILASVGENSTPSRYTLLPGADRTAYLIISNEIPGKLLRLQVKAYRGEGEEAEFSKPTSAVEVQAMDKSIFQPPLNLRATGVDDARIRIRWDDPSTTESGYFIDMREGGGEWKHLGNAGLEKRYNLVIESLKPATSYTFRVRAYKGDGQVVTGNSNEAEAKTAAFRSPSKLYAKDDGEGMISLKWKDRSSLEEGFEIQAREVDKQKYEKLFDVAADATSTQSIELKVGQRYDFRVRAFRTVNDKKAYSEFSNVASRKSTGLAMPTDLAISSTTNNSATLTWKDVSSREVGYTLRYKERGKKLPKLIELPAGTTAHTVTGLTVGKFYDFQVRAFDEKTVSRYTPVVQVSTQEGGPLVEKTFADIQVAKGSVKEVSVNGKFRDSDVSLARRFTTNLGDFDVVLFEDATPKTVQNFLAYADGGRYRHTFFHRAPTGFVVQGGGFTYHSGSFGKVSTFAPVQNEPGISNLLGTVAMAKLGGDPDSATSQFFINLSDANAANLDFQNEGFTVFGRIAGDGMNLFQEIDAFPKGSYSISPDGEPIALDDVPVNTTFPAPSILNPGTLVRVTKVEDSPILTYTATSLSPLIVTASLKGTTLRVKGLRSGTAKIRVRATDLDGLFVDQLLDVTVP